MALVVEELKRIQRQLPVPVRGIDSDNDGAFINDTLASYCQREKITFTMLRPIFTSYFGRNIVFFQP